MSGLEGWQEAIRNGSIEALPKLADGSTIFPPSSKGKSTDHNKENTMKTAEQKARDAATKWCAESGVLSPDGTYFNSLCYVIAIALKEQDRDTRHACAEVESVRYCKRMARKPDTRSKHG